MPSDSILTGLNECERIDFFCDIFYRELESWFSADIACCDYCYEDFVNDWPAIYFRNSGFQENGINIDCFYSGSRLSECFSLEESNKLFKNIKCPRCNNPIQNNFWPYAFNFNLPANFEYEMQQINKLSEKTPFLILSNNFAKKTLKEIKNIGQNISKTIINEHYYRARLLENDKTYREQDFSYPPKDKIDEERYNHAGFPVIYLADSEKTCFNELRNPRKGIAVAEVKFLSSLKILNLLELEEDDDSIINIASWSSLVSSSAEGEGKYKPHYTFTRFIGDCAIHAGFDAIKYPSVRNGRGHNIVLLNGELAWSNLKILNIRYMKFGINE